MDTDEDAAAVARSRRLERGCRGFVQRLLGWPPEPASDGVLVTIAPRVSEETAVIASNQDQRKHGGASTLLGRTGPGVSIVRIILLAAGLVALALALWKTAAIAPSLIQANGLPLGLAQTGAYFIAYLCEAVLIVAVTPFVAAKEAVGFAAVKLWQVATAYFSFAWDVIAAVFSFAWDLIAAVFTLLSDAAATVFSFTEEFILVPMAQFLQPGAQIVRDKAVTVAETVKDVAVWPYENVVQPAGEAVVGCVQDVFSWSYQRVLQPIGHAIGATATFVMDAVIAPSLNALAWAVAKMWQGLFWIGDAILEGISRIVVYLYEHAVVPVSHGIRLVGAEIGNGLGAAASWVCGHILAPVANAVSAAASASYHYVIEPVGSGIGWLVSTLASGIASAGSTTYRFVIEPVGSEVGSLAGIVSFVSSATARSWAAVSYVMAQTRPHATPSPPPPPPYPQPPPPPPPPLINVLLGAAWSGVQAHLGGRL